MFSKVKEDRYRLSMVPFADSASPRWAMFSALVILCAAGPLHAQDGAGVTPFKATVVDLSGQTEQVTVPLDRSVTIETNVELARAEVIARQVAEIRLVSPTRIMLTGQMYGGTSVILQGVNDQQYVFDVSVELDLDRLNESLKEIDPLANALAKSVRGHIALTGTVSSAERAERMVALSSLFLPIGADGAPTTTVQNHMVVAGEQQVLIRCLVAEMSRTALRELGVNGFLGGENFKDVFAVNQLGGINPINIGAASDAVITSNVPFLTGTEGIPLTSTPSLSLGFPRVQMQLFLRAVAENSLLSVLAEPNLVAISGETATFLAGGEFPIPVPQGNQQVTIQFRQFGIRLNFTPIVKGEQLIRLRVAPEVSELDLTTAVQIEGFVVPGLKSRSAETTVELGSGQTIAIGGLLNESVRGLATRVPAIGDVPVIGALFRSVSFQRSLSELVILVTPEIVAPLETHQKVPLPTDDRRDPDDSELYVFGMLNSVAAADANGSETAVQAETRHQAMLASEPDEMLIHGPWGIAEVGDMR